MRTQRNSLRAAGATTALALAALLGSSGCAHPAHGPYGNPEPPPLASFPSTEVYFYPELGQSLERQDRDRYDCYQWAVRQSHFDPRAVRQSHFDPRAVRQSRFDPSQRQVAFRQPVRVVPTRSPVSDTFAGAATGALIGGAASYSGEGAAIGAAIGAAVGAISDVHREHGRRQLERSLAAHSQPVQGRRANDYRRAMSACLEGRGYAVG